MASQKKQLGRAAGRKVYLFPWELTQLIEENAIDVSLRSKPMGKQGGKSWELTYQGRNLEVTLGTHDEPVEFPFGITASYNERTASGNGSAAAAPPAGWNQASGGTSVVPSNWGMGDPAKSAADVVDDGTKSLRISFKEDSQVFKMYEALETFVRNKIVEHNQQWRELPDGSKEIITSYGIDFVYNTLVKTTNQKNEPVTPGVNLKVYKKTVKVNKWDGERDEESGKYIYDPATLDDVTAATCGRLSVGFSCIYFCAKKWGVQTFVNQITVFPGDEQNSIRLRDDDEIIMRTAPSGLSSSKRKREEEEEELPSKKAKQQPGDDGEEEEEEFTRVAGQGFGGNFQK